MHHTTTVPVVNETFSSSAQNLETQAKRRKKQGYHRRCGLSTQHLKNTYCSFSFVLFSLPQDILIFLTTHHNIIFNTKNTKKRNIFIAKYKINVRREPHSLLSFDVCLSRCLSGSKKSTRAKIWFFYILFPQMPRIFRFFCKTHPPPPFRPLTSRERKETKKKIQNKRQ